MQQLHGGHQHQVTPQEVAGGDFWRFFRMNPPEFHGGLNPVEAYGGTPNMERAFPSCVGVQRQCSVTENNLKRVQGEIDQYGVGQMNQGGPSHQFRPRPRPFKRRQIILIILRSVFIILVYLLYYIKPNYK